MLFKNTTEARRAPIPVKTSPTFSIPRLVYIQINKLVGQWFVTLHIKTNAIPDLFSKVLSHPDLFKPVVPTILKNINIIF